MCEPLRCFITDVVLETNIEYILKVYLSEICENVNGPVITHTFAITPFSFVRYLIVFKNHVIYLSFAHIDRWYLRRIDNFPSKRFEKAIRFQ